VAAVGVWLEAARPRTLPAAIAPIGVGWAVALHEGSASSVVAAVCLLTALLLQVGANLANDVFDFERGADATGRLGPPRATQRGLVSPEAMRRAAFAVLALAATVGTLLIAQGGWPIAVAGALALAAAAAYTGGPWRLGYHGLGDLTVFVFFGGVGVVGSHYVQALSLSSVAVVAAVPVGLLATAILVVNNLRDLETDHRAGKRTLAVMMGERATRWYYVALVLGAPLWVLAAWALGGLPPGALLCLAAVPWLGLACAHLLSTRGGALNPLLPRTARLSLAFGGLLAVGIAL
jgi:1,4-dihydroxy-2-naphthoate octaprenyltransferase